MIRHSPGLSPNASLPAGANGCSPSSQAGFSLLEVSMALAVFLVTMLGAAASISAAMRTEMLVREHQAASDAGSARMDLVLSTDFELTESLWDGTAFHAATDYGNLAPTSGAYYPRAEDDPLTLPDEASMAGYIRIIRDPEGDGQTTLLEIRVVVAWTSADGTEQAIEYVSRKAE